MVGAASDLARIIGSIRRCFWLAGAVSDEMISDLGLTASLRAVLEHLHEFGPQTVPQIAREKTVKRQSIQALVDQLLELGLVAARENPAHRRSVLIAMTAKGKAMFREVQKREVRWLKDAVDAFDTRDLATTAGTLAALRGVLQSLVEDGDAEGG